MKNNSLKRRKRTLKRTTSDERMDLRISGENKFILQKAADLSGLGSTNSFVITAAVLSAQHVIEEYEGVLTSEKARKSFFAALENPSPPNQALRTAFKKHGEVIDKYIEHGV